MNQISILGVGDILVDRAEPTEAIGAIKPLLEQTDLSIGNFEGVLTDTHRPTPGSAQATVVPTSNAKALDGFTILSLANNHALDAGYGGLTDTMSTLSSRGIKLIGAGSSLADALAPVAVERQGIRVGVVAVTSVFPVGTQARKGLPGVAPLRAHDYYKPRSLGYFGPGMLPRVISVLDEGDWSTLKTTMEAMRKEVDLLIVSIHWGDFSRPWVLTDHEVSCARKLVDAGADLIFGHHHHFMRGVDFVQGKPVFYGLGNLAFDHPQFIAELRSEGTEIEGMSDRELAVKFGEFGIYPRPDSPNFPFHPLARKTGVALVEANKNGAFRCGIVPCMIEQGEITKPVRRNSAEWSSMLTFFRDCMEKGGLATDVLDTDWIYNNYDVLELHKSSV